jgi:predicted  nucleic acid-binding Zn-ribbon protein
MAPFFRRKTHMDKLQATLAQLRLRAAALTDKRVASADAVAARDRHNLEGDIADEQTSEKLQGTVDHLNSTLVGLDAALTTLQGQISDIEAQIAAERSAAEHKAASVRLEHDLNGFQKAMATYLAAARDFDGASRTLALRDWRDEPLRR